MVPILLYHAVSPATSHRFAPYALPPEHFARHLDLIVAEGFVPLTVGELVARRAAGRPDRATDVVITFDDGFADFAEHAAPALLERGLTATVYVTVHDDGRARWLADEGEGDRPLLTPAELRDLHRAGIEIGAHSCSHPQLDVIGRPAAEREIVRSRQRLTEILDAPVDTFAYPHGYHGRRVRQLVVDAGFSSACAVKEAPSPHTDDPWALARFTVLSTQSDEELCARLRPTGFASAATRERLRTRGWRLARRARHAVR